ncbi:molybdopterin-dependent oxidoreductase [Actinomadura rudentiformis]
MKFTMNGRPVTVDGATAETAVGFIRETAGLTGAKPACGTGACGACTILVDGTAVAGCLTLCSDLEGREVTTVEGLGGTHPVQRAFAAHDALQCGYCTPGFVVAAAAFVDGWRAEHGDTTPSRELIAEALAGHLCRCGAYPGIYAAVEAACAGEHDDERPDVPPARVEALEKITGAACYTTDVRLAGQWEGVIVRSEHAHAEVTSISGQGAQLVELLGADRIARYVGQPIAAVAAPTRAEALAAAARVQVEYRPLPAALSFDPEEAPDAAAVYPSKDGRRGAPRSSEGPPSPARWRGNLRGPSGLSKRPRTAVRRIEQAREGNDERFFSATFSTAVQAHTALEPHACLARWDTGGDLHLHVSTQAVDRLAGQVAKRWRLRSEQVHLVAEHVGGGFGAKVNLTGEVVAAVELARLTGAPVRVVLDRAEELIDGGCRPGTRTELAMLADAEGRLAALTMDVHGDGGIAVANNAASLARYIYGNAPRRLRDFDVVTNRPPAAPFRGPGHPPMLWALEQAVDEMAHRLGTDPIELRRRWDGNPKRQALYDWAAELNAWRDRPPNGGQQGRHRRGVGVAVANYLYFLDPGTKVELTVEQGVVVARTATQDVGTGSRSVISQVVRETLGVTADRVRVEIGRTGTVHGPAAASSCSTPSIGPAAHDAARRLHSALDGRSLDDAEGLRVVGRRPWDRWGYVTPFPIGDFAIGRGFTGAVYVTEVEVDTHLGNVRVTRVSCGIAAGRVYSPRLARSQCHGGVIQGVGYALLEQRHTDPATGVVMTDSLADYRIPGIADTPEIIVYFHQDGWDHVSGRGTGLGEVSTMGVAASIGNAVRNATGWRPLDLPISPDRLLQGLAE